MAIDRDKPLLDLVDRQINILNRLLSSSIKDLQKELNLVIEANESLPLLNILHLQSQAVTNPVKIL